MAKYEAIIKCINDKLKDNEILLEHYREETSKKDRRILELEAEVDRLMKACTDYAEIVSRLTEECKNKDEALEFLKNKLYGGNEK